MSRQGTQVIVVDGGEAFQFQPRDLLSVMNDITQAEQHTVFQFAFCRVDRPRDTKTKTTI